MKTLVIDANVFTKLIINEADTELAKQFFTTVVRLDVKLFVPELFKYEITAVTIKCKRPVTSTLKMLAAHMSAGVLNVVAPNESIWLKAEEVSLKGHEKSGFPSMYDSIYHALAIQLDTVFVTADKRHYEKTHYLGHIKLLNDWESLLLAKH